MLSIRPDILQAVRRLATAYFDVPKAEYSMIQNYQNGSILVEISTKTHLEISPITHIQHDSHGTNMTIKVLPAYNPVTQLDADDYTFFSEWVNRLYTEDEFVKTNRDSGSGIIGFKRINYFKLIHSS